MSQMNEIRKIQHIRYLEKHWFPKYISKNKKYWSRKYITSSTIRQYIKNKYLPEPINLTNDELQLIPGLYRKRIMLNNDNLIKRMPNKKANINVNTNTNINIFGSYNFNDITTNSFNNTSLIDSDTSLIEAMNNSIKEQELYFLKELDEAKKLSLKNMGNMDNDNNTLDIDDIELMQAIEQSLMNSDDKVEICVCLDLRIFGPNPEEPIYVNDVPYYLNENQINEIEMLWKKINDHQFKQLLEYHKTMAIDMKKLEKIN